MPWDNVGNRRLCCTEVNKTERLRPSYEEFEEISKYINLCFYQSHLPHNTNETVKEQKEILQHPNYKKSLKKRVYDLLWNEKENTKGKRRPMQHRLGEHTKVTARHQGCEAPTRHIITLSPPLDARRLTNFNQVKSHFPGATPRPWDDNHDVSHKKHKSTDQIIQSNWIHKTITDTVSHLIHQ